MSDDIDQERVIDELAQRPRPFAFTRAAVSQQTDTLAASIHASFRGPDVKKMDEEAC